MKNSIKVTACAALLAASSAVGALAQNRSAYFLDNYTYGYQMNPALAPDRKGEVSFPALGNLNFGVMGNFGVSSFFYNRNGKTVTFLHPDVSASEALGNIKNHNRLGVELREGIINVGFKAWGGYNHISINAVANAQARMPRSLFSFMKEGITNKTYDIGRVDVHADAYAEIALNHSRDLSQILPGLRVGASFKFLVGIANIDVNMDRADLVLGQDAWRAVTNGEANVAVKGFRYKTAFNNDVTPAREYIDGVDFDNFSAPNGYGMAIDLGATYEFMNDWKFSLAFTDIGFINWQHNAKASTDGEREFNSNNHTLDSDDIDSSWDEMKDDLTSLYQLSDNGESSRCRALEATMTVGAEYTLPYYRGLTFGLMNTTRMAHRFAWTEFRLSANIQPVKWFSAGINYGLGTFGSSFGWIINFAPKGFNLYVGMDRTLGKLAKQYVPLNSNAQLSVGINFPF